MISPAPPLARSAKYAASLPVFQKKSSRPVCIEPITTRLRSVVDPIVIGESRCGKSFIRIPCSVGVAHQVPVQSERTSVSTLKHCRLGAQELQGSGPGDSR